MSIAEINQVLALIDDWVQALAAEQLQSECRESGRSFFAFMQARGVNAALLARLIMDATGYNPAQLWRIDDADLLRDAIFRYEGTIATVRVDEQDGITGTAVDRARIFWGND